MKGFLVFLDSSGKILSEVVLENLPIKVGRAPQNQVVINDASISRLHVVIAEKNGQLMVIDQGSVNGIRLGAEKLTELPLNKALEFKMGEIVVRFSPPSFEDRTFTALEQSEQEVRAVAVQPHHYQQPTLTPVAPQQAFQQPAQPTPQAQPFGAPAPKTTDDLFSQKTIIRSVASVEAAAPPPQQQQALERTPPPRRKEKAPAAPRADFKLNLPQISMPSFNGKGLIFPVFAIFASIWIQSTTWTSTTGAVWATVFYFSVVTVFSVLISMFAVAQVSDHSQGFEFKDHLGRLITGFSIWMPLAAFAQVAFEDGNRLLPLGVGASALAVLIGGWALLSVTRLVVAQFHQFAAVILSAAAFVCFLSISNLGPRVEGPWAFSRAIFLFEATDSSDQVVEDMKSLFEKTAARDSAHQD